MTDQTQPQGIFRCVEHGTDSPLADKTWRTTGEFRPPREGEWFIWAGKRYGVARRAHEDIDSNQWIAEEVK